LKTRRRTDPVVGPPVRQRRALWRELADALAWQIDIGRLPVGERLPSTRTLASEFSISRNTVALAYDELASRGYIRLRVGDGAYVCRVEERTTAPLVERARRTCFAPDSTALVLIR
jgi:DNA-binding GntR family transcriptional regulator